MIRNRRSTRVAPCALEALESRLTPALLDTFLTTEHVDLGIGFTGSSWSLTVENEDKNESHLADKALLYVSAEKSRQSAPAGFGFLGVQQGQDFHQLPANQDPSLLYLGLSAEAVASSSVDSYSPAGESGGRVTGTGKYVRLTLQDVKGANGGAAPGHFSIWQVPLSSPVVFMATSDGINTGDGATADSLWLLAGGHQHFNFGFSSPGRYEVTFRASAFLNDNNPNTVGSKSQSGLVTFYFSVGGVGQMRFDSSSYTVDEAAGSKVITVTRAGGADGKVSVNYSVASGTATAGADFSAVSGTLTFNDLETTKTFTVPIIADGKSEGSETAFPTLSSPSPAGLASYLSANEQPARHLIPAPATALLTITENSLPTISPITNQSVPQGKSTAAIAFTVGDLETPAGSLIVTAKSSNTTLLPVSGIAIGGAGSARTVTATPSGNQPGNATITLTVTDTSGGSAETSFVVTFDDVPEDPTLAVITDKTTNEDTALDVPLTVGDPDGDALTISVTNAASFSQLASVVVSGTIAAPVLRFTPVADAFGGPVPVMVRATDPTGRFAERTFNLTVTPVNDPVVANDDSFQVQENAPATQLTVLANDSFGPPNENQSLTITFVGTPDRNGKASISGSVITYAPEANFFGSETFTYTVSDGQSSKTATVTVLVVAGDRSPAGATDEFQVGAAGDRVSGNILVNATDPNSDPIEARLFADPVHGTLALAPDGAFTYTPGSSFSGSDSFTYLPVQAGAILSGHADIGIGFEDGNFDLHVHDEESDVEYAAADATIFVGARSKVQAPAGLGFTGASAGETLWVLSGSSEIPGQVFLGLATEELVANVFTGDSIAITVDSFSGPGDFSIWNNSLGGPSEIIATSNGFANDSLNLPVGSHAHFNYGFTNPGEYLVTLRATGTLVAGGTTSAASTFKFVVSNCDPFLKTPVREGHVDAGIGFEDGAFDLHIHDEEADIEYEADEVPIFVSDAALIARPAGSAFDFIGVLAGERVWNIPASGEIPGLVFLGLATEEIAAGTFQGDKVTLSLLGAKGPGHFSLWVPGTTPSVKLASSDGITGSDTLDLLTGSHAHFNWTFSAPGEYAITFSVSGTPVGELLPVSAEATYTFAVSNGFPLVGSPVAVNITKASRLDFKHTVTSGHADVGIAFEDGKLELHVHDEEAGVEFAPSEVLIFVGPQAEIGRASGTAFDFLGVPAGAPVWVLPAVENPEIPFLGIGAEEIAASTFSKGSFKLSLASVSGPGEFAVYSIGGTGIVTIGMATSDGIGPEDTIALVEGSHAHQNWAFSAKGRYEVALRVSATLDDGTPLSDTAKFIFSVDGMGKVSFAVPSSTVAENAPQGFVNLLINRASGLDGKLVLDLATSGTASLGMDYSLGGPVVFADGQASATLKVALVNDFLFENPETATITITGAVPAGSHGVGSPAAHSLTITSEDRRIATDPTRVSVLPSAAGTRVQLVDIKTNFTRILTPIPGYSGGFNTVLGDIDNDGVRDLIVGTAGGTVGRVRVISGSTGTMIRDYVPYASAYRLVVNVGIGDINGDNRPDILVGTAAGSSPRVVAYSGASTQPQVLANFLAFAPNFRGGVRVASGDIDGNGTAEIIVSAASASNLVRIFNNSGGLIRQFAALTNTNKGLSLATADLNRDGRDEILVGSLTGTSRLGVYDNLGRLLKPIQSPLGTRSVAGVEVATADFDGDAITDILLSRVAGRGSEPRLVAIRFQNMMKIADLSFALLSLDESMQIR